MENSNVEDYSIQNEKEVSFPTPKQIRINGSLYELKETPTETTSLVRNNEVYIAPENRPMSEFQKCVIAIILVMFCTSFIVGITFAIAELSFIKQEK